MEASALAEKGLLALWALPPIQGPPECVGDLEKLVQHPQGAALLGLQHMFELRGGRTAVMKSIVKEQKKSSPDSLPDGSTFYFDLI